MFLIVLVIGLVGLVMMALPAFSRLHSTGGHLGQGHAGHALPTGSTATNVHTAASGRLSSRGQEMVPADADAPRGLFRLAPSPRAIFSVLALYGAFGNALVHAVHLGFGAAAALSALLALLVERCAVTPLWKLLFRFQGKPSGRMEELILAQATAVTPFRNGRGVVSVVRDGRLVQLSARLCRDEVASSVKVGDPLRIEEVDAERERVVVSIEKTE